MKLSLLTLALLAGPMAMSPTGKAAAAGVATGGTTVTGTAGRLLVPVQYRRPYAAPPRPQYRRRYAPPPRAYGRRYVAPRPRYYAPPPRRYYRR
ncbi:hypothetical protein ACFQY5_29880 [Paeniroseomonas aquatica]|uniref:hypothetical protein n=1 Tax=Paeniroseomonas aquatica TaxID=373043 RepID=UPI003615C5BD